MSSTVSQIGTSMAIVTLSFGEHEALQRFVPQLVG